MAGRNPKRSRDDDECPREAARLCARAAPFREIVHREAEELPPSPVGEERDGEGVVDPVQPIMLPGDGGAVVAEVPVVEPLQTILPGDEELCRWRWRRR